jgi:signal transduction histidine kinase
VKRYLAALGCAAIAVTVTKILGPWAEPDFTALFALAVLCASTIGGLGPGLLATLLATAGTAYAQAGWTPAIDIGRDDAFRLGVFAIVAVIVSSLAARQRAAEEQLRGAVTRLKDADAAKDRVLASLSHELRTPLTSMLGWASLLAEPDVDAATIAVAADSIRQSARSQQVLIDDLLDLSRIVFGKFQLNLKPDDLVPLIRASADLIRPAAEEKAIALTTTLPPEPCLINGDGQRIRQVVWNFLTNAVKFTPPGGRIDLRLSITGMNAQVIVSDTGEGIAPASLARIFDRFQQGEDSTSKGGLGLGLAIAKFIVEAHGGSIAASSDGRGRGATFVATFPLAEHTTRSSNDSARRVTEPSHERVTAGSSHESD